jgi:microsomal dipeptidase-like Zn-dependent dipeptidase
MRRWFGYSSLSTCLLLTAIRPAEAGKAPTQNPQPELVAPKLRLSTIRNAAVLSKPALKGWVDLHAHPMAHLGFGKKLIHGAPDVGSLVPAGTRDCNGGDLRATSIQQALGHDNSTHGGHDLFNNTCGDYQRNAILRVFESENGAQSAHGSDKGGYPNFAHWPRYNDVTHQQMWVDWIKRAHQHGMRVMVALAVNNQTLARALKGDGPIDDKSAGDLQVKEIRSFVARHDDFMEVALSAADLRRIVTAGKLAVVLGLELDDLGNFDAGDSAKVTRQAIVDEVERLHGLGVRYVIPIHMVDNAFGGTAAYEPFLNAANRIQHGGWWSLECTKTTGWTYTGDDMLSKVLQTFGLDRPPQLSCPSGSGQRNSQTLTTPGKELLEAMMRKGMLVDVDHMSERAVDATLRVAENFADTAGGGYPLMSGHNGLRGNGGSERLLTEKQLQRIVKSGGMLGLGWGDGNAEQFLAGYRDVRRIVPANRVGFGTDMNGVIVAPSPGKACAANDKNCTLLPTFRTGNRVWDYTKDGVAHYGLIPDFVQDLRNRGGSIEANELSTAAEGFAAAWERAALVSRKAPPLAALPPEVAEFEPPAIGWFCPSRVVGGDREFGGHGPELWANADAAVTAGGTVEVRLEFRAKETQHDWSETTGTWTRKISPDGMRVKRILSSRTSSTHTLSSPAGFQVIAPGAIQNAEATPRILGGNLVRTFEIVGDTGGPDISDDDNCNDDTRIRVVFNRMQVELAR